jgi:hypothetical protein
VGIAVGSVIGLPGRPNRLSGGGWVTGIGLGTGVIVIGDGTGVGGGVIPGHRLKSSSSVSGHQLASAGSGIRHRGVDIKQQGR